jgi:hypothetical protein
MTMPAKKAAKGPAKKAAAKRHVTKRVAKLSGSRSDGLGASAGGISGDGARLSPPPNGVAIRMYRQGHGDCFLMALPRVGKPDGPPVFVLIDCGLKPGSQDLIHRKTGSNTFEKGPTIGEIVGHIGTATDDRLDLVVITHEHQDHLNGIWKQTNPYFDRFQIAEAWMAWTEDPDDKLANELRKRHGDQLLGLIAASRRLAAEDSAAARRVDTLLSLELGGEDVDVSPWTKVAIAGDLKASVNKQALKLVRDKASANRGVSYLSPGQRPLKVPGTNVRVYVLGPPRDANLIADEDPRGSEGFPADSVHGFTFGAAAAGEHTVAPPFKERFGLRQHDAMTDPFFAARYGTGTEGEDDTDRAEATNNAPWRRIDNEWLYSAENLALKLNAGINNTSLVLAFELPNSKKILFFAGDAQRGNWISWTQNEWKEGAETITVRDLLARTVLYKVGHHGSHNATLNGTATDPHASLEWMATGPAAGEFTAMITAVNEWAMTKNNPPWRHPLPSIKRALVQKTQGRVFQTDEAVPSRPDGIPDGTWNAFLARSVFNRLYFEYSVLDE